jgi:hypothetical protein
VRPLLVGEDNPYSRDPRYALYPEPEHSAGGRLCRLIMRLSVKDYIRGFERANLCAEDWSIREARDTARDLCATGDRVLVLLGKKVCAAFGVDYLPYTWLSTAKTVILPHPSGRSRAWNEAVALERAHDTLVRAGVLPLPPWPPKEYPRKATGEWLELLMSTDSTTSRPAWCSNCHLIVRGEHCPECGPQA